MGLGVVTNLAAMGAYRNLQVNSGRMTGSLARLSSGLRIGTAADDAAGLAISTGLQSQITGTGQAVRNTQDGISVVRTADGALGETDAILQRMRDLAVQAANTGAMDGTADADVRSELGQLEKELDRIASTTSFGGIPLLDGGYAGVFQVGADAGDTVQVTIPPTGRALDTRGLGLSSVGSSSIGFLPGTLAPAVPAVPGTPTSTLPPAAPGPGLSRVFFATPPPAPPGPAPARLSLAGDYVSAGTYADSYANLVGTIAYNGRSFDLGSVDYPGAVTAQDYLDRLDQAAQAALGTSFTPFVATATGLVFTGETPGPASTADDAVALTPTYWAHVQQVEPIQAIDQAIARVSSVRAYLGAVDNGFQHTVARLGTTLQNTTAAVSRIRDTDMAAEMSSFSRSSILVQAGTAMLAQANQASQGLLKLLG